LSAKPPGFLSNKKSGLDVADSANLLCHKTALIWQKKQQTRKNPFSR
jgi:hypothetical protein